MGSSTAPYWSNMATLTITYRFDFPIGKTFVYPLLLDDSSVSLISDRKRPPPDWTRLRHYQCGICTFVEETNPYCPIAVNISDLVEDFKEVESTEEVQITVHTQERIYMRRAAIQKGLSSILGVIMATSGCPRMNFLRPMARYHLPFSTSEETIVRSVSMYLLGEYFIAKKKGQPDLTLRKLDSAYSMVQKVNQGICARITTAIRESEAKGDAANNAVVILDAFSQLLKSEIEQKLESLAGLFRTFE